MLLELYIENFTIINKCHIELQNGMTVFTGETGAGKSILVDALGFVLGGRSDSKYIRHDQESADISASFQLEENGKAALWLNENGYDIETCILRRLLTRDGRNKAYINGKPATVQQLKMLGSLLVNIHGQHEHYALLKREEQMARLDHYAGHYNLLKKVAESYASWRQSKENLEFLKNQQSERESRLHLLNYQIEELEQFALSENELEVLHLEQQKLSQAAELIQQSGNALQQLYENEPHAILSQLTQLHKQFAASAHTHSELNDIATMLHEAMINIKECSSELRLFHDTLSLDPERLHIVENRLESIYKQARKHRVAPEQLYAHYQSLICEKESLTTAASDLDKLTTTLQKQSEIYLKHALALTESRQKAAHALGKEVTVNMQNLGLHGGKLSIEFTRLPEFSPKGQEQIRYLVSTNPGQPLLAINDVVSGGELSRIGLAIQVLTAEQQATPTLIFDEVDAGIGGGTAEVVGKLLQKLGAHCQVLCVTHLPQVAAQAMHHIYVEKIKNQDNTISQLQVLDEDSRSQEIARMLGGLNISKQTLITAKEMLSQAKS